MNKIRIRWFDENKMIWRDDWMEGLNDRNEWDKWLNDINEWDERVEENDEMNGWDEGMRWKN